jgi:fructose-specific component phosphotransferase system IIB-like protein
MKITITIDSKLAERFKLYADLSNQTVAQVAQAAVTEWMDISGEADLEVVTGIPAPDVHIPPQSREFLLAVAGHC